MCGIVGVVSRNPISEDVVSIMTGTLKHRGPDADGTYFNRDRTIALGHTRLSIIDLSDSANQPFISSDGRYILTFNGEIYNFQKLRQELQKSGVQFRTDSDTEVIVEGFAHWGKQIVNRLEGMFALAIFDKKDEKLFLLRDRFGKKPLYYFQNDQLFVFASELKAITSYPAIGEQIRINGSAISRFLHLGYIPERQTIYNKIFKFPAGCYGDVDKNFQLDITPYWQLSKCDFSPRIQSLPEAKSEFGKLLEQAVEKRLISDVPLGVFLSGGVDSSLITAITAKIKSTPVKTFSIGFHESKFDESNNAKEIAGHFKTDHTKFILPEKEAAAILDTYLNYFDEPFADTSSIPTMIVSQLARKEVTVALTGDGGDELFMGYGSYKWADRLENPLWKSGKHLIPFLLRLTGKNRFKRIAHLVDAPNENLRSHIFSQEQYFFSQQEIEHNLLSRMDSFRPFVYDESFLDGYNLRASEKQALFDLQFYLKDDLLTKVDRASMYFGLECRCPLLDDAIVNFALRLPYSFKIRNGVQKWFLKEVLSDYLPRQVVNRPKWGFSIPLAKWMKGDLNYLMEYLSEEKLTSVGVFNVQYVRKLVERFYAGDEYLYNRLWVIIIMQRFLLNHGKQ